MNAQICRKARAIALVYVIWLSSFPMGISNADSAPPAGDLHAGTPGNGSAAAVAAAEVEASKASASARLGRLPLSFEVNLGQADSHVRFISRGAGCDLLLTRSESILELKGIEPPERASHSAPGKLAVTFAESPQHSRAPKVSMLGMKLLGSSTKNDWEGKDRLEGKVNYLIGNRADLWRSNIPTFSSVIRRAVYPGIDMVYYGNNQQLEYDFIVSPGANLQLIQMDYSGVNDMEVDGQGNLSMALSMDLDGGRVLQKRPVAYQVKNGVRQPVDARYEVKGKHRAGIRTSSYDKTLPLVIDPALVYSTYFGMGGTADIQKIAVDAAGSTYFIGSSTAALQATPGAFLSSTGGLAKMYVAKLDAAGNALVYCTYLGGASANSQIPSGEYPGGIAVDGSGNAFVTGYTYSADFPTTTGAFQPTIHARLTGSSAFVTKLNSSGSALIYSTFLGGSILDVGRDIAIDSSGNAFVTGSTISRDFPTTSGSFQPLRLPPDPPLQPGSSGFVTKLDAQGASLVYSTYLGARDGNNACTAISVDTSGAAYVTGTTTSTAFPTTAGAFQTSAPLGTGGDRPLSSTTNAFVTKLKSDGSGLTYSTYLGGSRDDYTRGIAVDSQGNAYIAGSTNSPDFPASGAEAAPFGRSTYHRSVDGGSNWNDIDTTQAAGEILDVEVDPNHPSNVYTVGSTGSLARSTDAGSTWRLLTLPAGRAMNVKIDPRTSTIYANTLSSGLFRSSDSGETWSMTTLPAGLPGAPQLQAIDPQTSALYAAGYPSPGLTKSTDGGATWTVINTNLIRPSFLGIGVDPRNSSRLVASFDSNVTAGLGFSTNGGASWTLSNVTDAGNLLSVIFDPQTPGTIYACLPLGSENALSAVGRPNPRRHANQNITPSLGSDVIKSTDGGMTWLLAVDGLVQGREPHVIAMDPKNSSALYAGTESGVARTTDGGLSWSYIGGLHNTISALAIDTADTSRIHTGSDVDSRGFVARLNPEGSDLVYSFFLGGGGSDNPAAIALDAAGNAFVVGSASSPDFPTTSGALRSVLGAGSCLDRPPFCSNAFLVRVSASGSITYSTMFGGTGPDGANVIVVDPSGNNVYLGGSTSSTDFPVVNPLQSMLVTGVGQRLPSNAYLARIDLSQTGAPAPVIMGASLQGKRLIVTGANFIGGSVILINGQRIPTVADSQSPSTTLICKKARKLINLSEPSMLEVMNPDGRASNLFSFTPPAN